MVFEVNQIKLGKFITLKLKRNDKNFAEYVNSVFDYKYSYIYKTIITIINNSYKKLNK